MYKTLISCAFLLSFASIALANSDPEPVYPVPNFDGSESWHVLTTPETVNYKDDEHFQAAYVSDIFVADWTYDEAPGVGHYAYQCGPDDIYCAAIFCSTDGVMQFGVTDYNLDASVLRFWQLDPRRKTKQPMTLMASKFVGPLSKNFDKPLVAVSMPKALLFEFNQPNPENVLDFSYSMPNAVELANADEIRSHVLKLGDFFDQFHVIVQECNARPSTPTN